MSQKNNYLFLIYCINLRLVLIYGLKARVKKTKNNFFILRFNF